VLVKCFFLFGKCLTKQTFVSQSALLFGVAGLIWWVVRSSDRWFKKVRNL